MNYPSKPWNDGQTAELVGGETYIYDATNSVWNHVTKATLDSDYQIDKAVIESDITGLDTRLTTAEGEIDTLQSDVSTLQADVLALGGLTDSDAARISANVTAINAAYAMLDSDSINIQGLRTDLEAEIASTNSEVSTLQSNVSTNASDISGVDTRLTTAEGEIDTLQSDVSGLAIPVVSSSQPTGQAGLLWVNLNDGKLYYWDTVEETFTEVGGV